MALTEKNLPGASSPEQVTPMNDHLEMHVVSRPYMYPSMTGCGKEIYWTGAGIYYSHRDPRVNEGPSMDIKATIYTGQVTCPPCREKITEWNIGR